jgi:hypothetical protein
MISRNNKKAQAAFEYLVTYGWAFLGAIIAVGALAYFGFLSPSNLLPNSCNFGKQMECSEYRIFDDGEVGFYFKNNFGKKILITDVQLAEGSGATFTNGPVSLDPGTKAEVLIQLDSQYIKRADQKQELTVQVNFTRDDGVPSSNHFVTGTVFTTVQAK